MRNGSDTDSSDGKAPVIPPPGVEKRRRVTAETMAANGHGNAHSTAGFKALMLGSIGVVYGDIGTSPLYAFRECFGASHRLAPTAFNVFGVLSLLYKYQSMAPDVTECFSKRAFFLPTVVLVPALLGLLYQQTMYPATAPKK